MNVVAMRRGACPALSAPMQTGDGLLVRLNLAEGGMTPGELGAQCALAERHGNGIVEVTARGSFQIRGLTAASAPVLAADVAALALDLRDGVPVETSPLAGLDPDEIADPLPLVRAIRSATESAGLARRLAPKFSIVVDGGGNVDLAGNLADIRLTAMQEDEGHRWLLAIGGDARSARPIALLDEGDAVAAVLVLLEAVAALGASARGRDLPGEALDAVTARVAALRSFAGASAEATGGTERHAKRRSSMDALRLTDGRYAASVGLPFGSIQARTLAAFVAATGARDIRLAPQRSLILIVDGEEAARVARETARAHDLVVDPADPRRAIAACPGAPACATGQFDTRELARRLARNGLLHGSVHVSGCAKGCAHPTKADLVAVGTGAGIALIRNGRASDAPFAMVSSAEDALARLQEHLA